MVCSVFAMVSLKTDCYVHKVSVELSDDHTLIYAMALVKLSVQLQRNITVKFCAVRSMAQNVCLCVA